LPSQGHEAPNREHETDVDLRPFVRGQIDGDKRTKAGLDIGNKEDKSVQPPQAAQRWTRRWLVLQKSFGAVLWRG